MAYYCCCFSHFFVFEPIFLSASAVVLHYETALYQVYAPLPFCADRLCHKGLQMEVYGDCQMGYLYKQNAVIGAKSMMSKQCGHKVCYAVNECCRVVC